MKRYIEKFRRLLGIAKFDFVACDLNPAFETTKLAREIAKKHNARLVKVQHHFAHLASVMLEKGLNKAVGIICDGFGLGTDKTAWGGEILRIKNNKMERIVHLSYFPLIGIDKAVKEPIRIAVGIMSKFMDEREISNLLGINEKKIEIWLKQIEENFNVIQSSSCGRFLDAVSVFLGVCREEAMKVSQQWPWKVLQ